MKAIKVDDYRLLARRRLPKVVFDFLEGGAEDERGLAHNRAVFSQVRFRPRRFVDVGKRSLETTVFGRSIAAPLAIAPVGGNSLLWPQGDLILAQAAAHARIPFVLSTAASMSIEEIAKHSEGERWFQLYVVHREIAEQLAARALAADYSALVLTTDVAINGFRERDARNRFMMPVRYSLGLLMDGARHPRWSIDYLRHGAPQMANLSSREAMSPAVRAALMSRQMDASFGWDDLKRLRDRWPRTLIVKGLLDAEDAARCFELGVDGVILSNHGARQLDDAPSPLDVLQETVARAEAGCVMADSGFRRGADVVKAVALGARLVLLGRAVLYGLAARGRSGVDDVIGMMKAEIDCTLAQLGCASVADLAPTHVMAAKPPMRGSPLPSSG